MQTEWVADRDGVPSPGTWEPPEGTSPAWNWVPANHGLTPRLDRVPRVVRLWFKTPFIDRWAYVWMWNHGGWDISPLADPGAPSTGEVNK